MKKRFVLGVLFIFPLATYLFFASGVNNFAHLPILTENIPDICIMDPEERLTGKITILGFLGNNIEQKKGSAFNLNQTIYKQFRNFNDFQLLMIVPQGSKAQVKSIKKELSQLSKVDKWRFAFGTETQIQSFFNTLQTNLSLDENLFTPYVFIIDKARNLRGRKNDKEKGRKYGFNTTSVAELNNKMEDDVKVILAEYRLALKQNHANSSP